jgi:hypothetical protein
MQGTEAKMNEFKNMMQGLWMSAFNSQDLQMFIGGLTSLANSFKYVVDHVGLLPPALAIAGVAMIAFNGGIKSIMTNGMLMISMFKGIPVGLTSIESALAATTLRTNILNTATKTLTITMGALKNVGIFLAGSVLPIAAFMAIGFAIEKITQAVSDYNQKQQEAKQKQDDLVKSYSSNSDQINKLASKYKDLSSQVADGKISSSNQDFLDTMNQLGKLMPDLVVSEDAHGNKILASADAVKKELDYAKQLKEIQDKTTIANFEKDLDSQASKIDTILKNIDKYKNEAKGLALSPMVQSGNSKYFDQGSVLEDQRQQLAQERELQLALQNSKSYIQDKAKAYMDIEGTSQKLSSSQQKIITSYINEAVASKKTVKDGEDFKKFLSDTTSKAADLAAILALLPNDITNILSIGEIGKLSDKQISALRKVGLDVKNGGTNWDEYRKILEKAKIPVREISQIIYGLSNNLKENTSSQKDYNAEVQKTIETEMQKATASEKIVGTTQSLLDQTKDQVIVYQQLSSMENLSADQKQQLADAIGTLSAMYPEYAKNGELNVEQIQKEISADGILLKALTDVKDGHANAEETMTMNMALQTKQRIQMIKDQISSYQKLVDAIIASAEADGGTMTGARSKVYEDTSGKIADLQKQLDDLTNTYDGQIKTLSDTQSTTNKSIYVTDQYKNSIDALDASLKKLQSETENYARGTQAYEDALQRQINLLKQKKDLTDAQAKSLQQQIASGNIVQTGMITNSSSSGSSSSSSNYNYASGNSIAAQIWNFLKGKGLSDGAIAGIMGNLQQESSLNPNAPGGGLAQWIGSRGTALKNYAGSMGLSSNSLQAQLGYLWQELSSGSGGASLQKLNSLSADQAALYFSNNFERPAAWAANNAKRQQYANQFLSQFAGSGGTYSGGSSTTSSGDIGKSAAETAPPPAARGSPPTARPGRTPPSRTANGARSSAGAARTRTPRCRAAAAPA